MTKFIKKPIFLFFLVLSAGLVLGLWHSLSKPKDLNYDIVLAKKGNITQEVDISGKVKPAKEVALAFETGGKVSRVYADVGQKVVAGQKLAQLDQKELVAQLQEAKATLKAEKAKLAELKQGTRPEEIRIQEIKLENAQRSLKDAQINLQKTKTKSEEDLNRAYIDALGTVQEAVTDAKSALLTLTDIQYAHFIENSYLTEAKARAVKALLGADNAGLWTTDSINLLNGGAWKTVQEAINNPSRGNIDRALEETTPALKKTKEALEAVPIDPTKLTSTEKSSLSGKETTITNEIAAVLNKKQAILTQKAINASAIQAAETNILNARNNLDNARKTLELKQAGSRSEEILAQEARIESAQANIQYLQARIAKTSIFSPINGIVVKQEAKVGQTVPAGQEVISVISSSKFQIEANVPETDIPKLKIGDTARITLDALGQDIVFKAKVVKIEPAATIVDGVPSYKTTFQFAKNDERIKPGMSADVNVLCGEKRGVIVLPSRAIISRGSKKFVRVLIGQNNQEVEVKTGLQGSDGKVEILKGIKEGDRVIDFAR